MASPASQLGGPVARNHIPASSGGIPTQIGDEPLSLFPVKRDRSPALRRYRKPPGPLWRSRVLTGSEVLSAYLGRGAHGLCRPLGAGVWHRERGLRGGGEGGSGGPGEPLPQPLGQTAGSGVWQCGGVANRMVLKYCSRTKDLLDSKKVFGGYCIVLWVFLQPKNINTNHNFNFLTTISSQKPLRFL